MKISNYSLNYPALRTGEMDPLGFLTVCHELGVEGASIHVRNLPESGSEYLKRLRRGYLDSGLSVSMFSVTTNFGSPEDQHGVELDKAREAIRIATFLGAPILRVFAGSPPSEGERQAAFERAIRGIRRVCEEAANVGLPVGLQNHNHGALVRTGEEVVRFIRGVDHPNFTLILDTGQFAGSRGASGSVPDELKDTDFMESIRLTASLASYVRVKFYRPRADGSEPWIDYAAVLDILRGVHYQGFLDIVYEPSRDPADPGDPAETAIPRIVTFLRRQLATGQSQPAPLPSLKGQLRYAGLQTGRYAEQVEVRSETAVAFLEGPAVSRSGSVYFTNIPARRILEWNPEERRLSVFREQSNRANGLMFDRQGRLLACEGGGRVTRTEMGSGEITTLADQYAGRELGAPNDLDLDSQGRVYFTSRLANQDPEVENVNSVYRIDGPGQVVRVLHWPNIDMPNGIVVSPDDKTLYLIDADGKAGRARRIRAYDLGADGSATHERTLYDFYPGRSGDGMAIDAQGNLWVAAGLHRRRGSSETLDTHPGIHVISPEGKLLAFVQTPEDSITNCSFGGPDLRTLYITCGKFLLSLRTRIAGKSSYRPEA